MGLFKPTDLLPVILTICDCICNFVCRVPQIIRLIKLKRSEAISTTYWIFFIVFCFLCITFYILTGNIPFLITASINLIFNVVVLVLTCRYRR